MSGYNSLFKTCNYKLILSNPLHKDLEFFITETSIPAITVGTINAQYASMTGKIPGDSLTYDNLTTTILVDEDMKVMDDIFSTLRMTHNPESNELKVDPIIFDATLIINTNKNNPIRKLIFKNMWLETFSEVNLSSTSTDDNNIQITAGWCYDYYVFDNTAF